MHNLPMFSWNKNLEGTTSRSDLKWVEGVLSLNLLRITNGLDYMELKWCSEFTIIWSLQMYCVTTPIPSGSHSPHFCQLKNNNFSLTFCILFNSMHFWPLEIAFSQVRIRLLDTSHFALTLTIITKTVRDIRDLTYTPTISLQIIFVDQAQPRTLRSSKKIHLLI